MTIYGSFFYGLVLSGKRIENQLGIQPDTLSPSEKKDLFLSAQKEAKMAPKTN